MQLVDTHCHIQSIGKGEGEEQTRQLWAKAGDLTPDNVIERAKEAGVTKLICVGCDLADSQLAIDYVSERSNCWASIGIHPHEAKHYAIDTSEQAKFKSLVTKNKVVAIGECGLDYFYGHSPKEDQLKALSLQLELAQEYNLPVIFHVREAFTDFWPVLDNFKGIHGVLHSYTDNEDNLKEGIRRGLYFGVNGIATFARDITQIEMYKSIPLEALLLETDSPFLTPVPYRGTINEPSKVEIVAKYLADLRGESLSDLATATTANARQLFGI